MSRESNPTAGCIGRWLPASVIGLSVTVAFLVLSFSGAVTRDTADVLLWPATILVGLIPRVNIGTLEDPFYEATPIHLLAWLAGLILCVPVYTLAADVLIRILKRLLRP